MEKFESERVEAERDESERVKAERLEAKRVEAEIVEVGRIEAVIERRLEGGELMIPEFFRKLPAMQSGVIECGERA